MDRLIFLQVVLRYGIRMKPPILITIFTLMGNGMLTITASIGTWMRKERYTTYIIMKSTIFHGSTLIKQESTP